MKEYHVPRIEREEVDSKCRQVRFSNSDHVRELRDKSPTDKVDYFLTTKYLQIWPNRESAAPLSILKNTTSKPQPEKTNIEDRVDGTATPQPPTQAPTQETTQAPQSADIPLLPLDKTTEEMLRTKVARVEEIVKRNQELINGGISDCFCDICTNNYLEVKADGTSEYAFKRCPKTAADILDVIARSKELLERTEREVGENMASIHPYVRQSSPTRQPMFDAAVPNDVPRKPLSPRYLAHRSRSPSPYATRGRVSPASKSQSPVRRSALSPPRRSVSSPVLSPPPSSSSRYRPRSPSPRAVRKTLSSPSPTFRATSPRSRSPRSMSPRSPRSRSPGFHSQMTASERQRFLEVTGRVSPQKRDLSSPRPKFDTNQKWRKIDTLPDRRITHEIDVSRPRILNSFDPTTPQNASMHSHYPATNQQPTTFSLANETSARFKFTNQNPAASFELANSIEAEQKRRLEKLTELELRIRTMEKLMKEI